MKPDDDISDKPLTRIVCAAIRRRSDGLVICGARHFDPVMRAVLHALGYSIENKPVDFDQGFLTNTYNWDTKTYDYVDRETGWKIAEAAGQIREHKSIVTGRLHSEDLY